MTVKEIKEMIKNMNDNDEVIFTIADRDRDGHQVNTIANVNNIFNKTEVKINIVGEVEKIWKKVLTIYIKYSIIST